MLDEHLGYVDDAIRLEQFRSAIAQVVHPGGRIADLGCGSGVLGLLCLQAGASHVVAIDSSAMIEVARQTMARAGLADRCTFIHARSHRAMLPEHTDVVICDHVGFFGFDYGIVHTMQDARRNRGVPGVLHPACTQTGAGLHCYLFNPTSACGHTITAQEYYWAVRPPGVLPCDT